MGKLGSPLGRCLTAVARGDEQRVSCIAKLQSKVTQKGPLANIVLNLTSVDRGGDTHPSRSGHSCSWKLCFGPYVCATDRAIVYPVCNIIHDPIQALHEILSCDCTTRENRPVVGLDVGQVQRLISKLVALASR